MTTGFPLLTIIVFLPAAAALVVAFLPRRVPERAVMTLGLLAAIVELGFVAYLVVDFQGGQAGFQFVSQHQWISYFGISWKVGVDGISLFLVAMTALLFPVAMAGPTLFGNTRAFLGWMLVLEAACMGVFLAMDLFLFFVMFEITLVPGYFIISGWGGLRRNYAAMKFFIYTFAGSAFLFVGILALVLLTAPANGGHETFDLIRLTQLASNLPHADQVLIFASFAVAFAVKTPLVPFHSWLPDAYTQAPTAGSMILAGILFKLGAYGMLRFGVFVLPRGAADLGPVLLTLAALGIVYGALITIMQKDLKRLVAYASIVDVAFIVLGFFAFSAQGVTGGVLEMVNHALTTGAIFFLVGVIWEHRGTLRFSDLGGLQRAAPVLAAIFLTVVLSAVGLPGLNGFVGEFLVLVGTFITHRWWAVVGTTAIISGAIYLLWAYQRVFWGPIRVERNAAVRDITWRQIGAVAPLLVGIVFLGIYPRPVLDRITPSVNHLLAHVQHVDPSAHVPAPGAPAVAYSVPDDQNVDGRGASGTARAGGPGASAAAARGQRWTLMIGAIPAGAALLAQASGGGNGCSIAPGGNRITGVCTADNSLHIPVAYASILPILILSGGALVILLVSAVLPKRSWPGLYPLLTALIGVISLAASVWQWFDVGTKHARLTIGQQVIYDRFSVFFLMLISVATVLGALVADSYLRREDLDGVEGYALMLLAGTGAMLMAVSGGLIMLFLGLEIMSIALYVMAAFHRRRVQSGEAGFKYFILGSFSSAIFLYGIALVYGATGSTQFHEIASFLAGNVLLHNGVLLAGMALLIVGLGFKVAAVPFHFWTPDVYQGAPTPFTGYMAAVAKAAGFAGLLRVLNGALGSEQANWRPAIWLITVLTLAVGSVLALAQKDIKRMFAYSSISQAGYVLVGVQAASSQGTAGALYYLFTYTFIIIGTFAVVEVIQGPGEARNDLGAIRGLSRRQPLLALAMLIFLLAQAGMPFTTGFLGKFYVISAAIQRGQYALGIIAMLAAAVAAFFYLRVALLMYSPAPAGAGEPAPVERAPAEEVSPGAAQGAPVAVGAGTTPRAATGVGAGAGPPAAGAAGQAAGGTNRVPIDGDGQLRDDTLIAGLEPLPGFDAPVGGGPAVTAPAPAPAVAGTSPPAAGGEVPAAALEPPPEGRIAVPVMVTVTLALCAAFTVVAGVSAFMITFARQATTLF